MKQVTVKQKVFSACIDFKRAFDTVPTDKLLYKLHRAGIDIGIIRLIKDMYEKSTVAVKLTSGVTRPIACQLGLKQGCPLSPLLFDIFINDFEEFLNVNGSYAVEIGNKKLCSLIFADDVLIMADSAGHFQYLLQKLSLYSSTWGLEVNTCKSSVIVFNRQGKPLEDQYKFS